MFSCLRSVRAALLPLLFLLPAGVTGGETQDPAQAEFGSAATDAYKILEIDRRTLEKLRLLRIRALLREPPEETWAVIENLDDWPEFFHLFDRVRLLESADDLARYRFYVSPPWPLADFESVVSVKSAPGEQLLIWRVEEGGMAGMFGRILVKEATGGAEIVYESYDSAKKTFPAWVVKIGLYIVLPGVLEDLTERIREQFPAVKPDPA